MTISANLPLVIPAEILQSIGKSEQEMRIELAVIFYVKFNLSSSQAARFAGIPRVAFTYELGKRNVPVNYDEADALHDVETMRTFNQKFPVRAK